MAKAKRKRKTAKLTPAEWGKQFEAAAVRLPKKTLAGDEELVQDIVDSLCFHVHTFGGGREHGGNPIAAAMKDKAPVFALGVDVKAVVRYVLNVVDAGCPSRR